MKATKNNTKDYSANECIKHGSLSLYDDFVVSNNNGFWNKKIEEIPISKINSIFVGVKRKLKLLIFGILLLASGLFFMTAYTFIGIGIIICGSIIIIISLFWKNEIIEIRSSSTTVKEKAKNSELFLERLRKKMYSK